MKKKRMLMAVLCVCLIGSVASAGTLTSGTTAPTSVVASGVPDASNYTKIFALGVRTDGNEGRGNEIFSDSGGSLNGYTMDALVIRKDGDQDFSSVSEASLTLYVFEGTKEMWDLGDGFADSDLFNGTGITTTYTETFALTGTYAEGDYITLTLDAPITMAADMGWYITMDQGTTGDDHFRVAQLSSWNGGTAAAAVDGNQYQAPDTGNFYTASPLEYYVIGELSVSPTGQDLDPLPTQITWDPPTAYTPEVGYDLIVRTAVQENEPNFAAGGDILEKTGATATSPESVTLAYDSTYWCSLTAYEPNGVASDYTDDIPHTLVWSFTTAAENKTPIVTFDPSRFVTWPDEFPDDIVADVNDLGDGDIDTVDWEFVYGPGVAVDGDAMMMDRENRLGNIASDPNLYRDWIGTKCNNGGNTSDVLTLTLSGLPTGSYTWKSYHYDAYPHSSTDVFDVTVTDSTGAATTTDVAQSAGTSEPNVFETTITSDGSDVTLEFVGYNDAASGLFTMNAFELTGSGDPLYVDFTKQQTYPDPNFVQPGYQGYLAISGDLDSFTAQSFGAFGTTVTITPDWDAAGMEITGISGTTPTSTATVDIVTDVPRYLGQYQIRATATDTEDLVGSGEVIIQVTEDACAAAQYLGAGLSVYDADENCIVDLADLAAFAVEWLDDVSLSGPTAW